MSKDKELHQRHMSRRKNRDSLVGKEHMPEKWEWAAELKEKVLKKPQPLLDHPHSYLSRVCILQAFLKCAPCCVLTRWGRVFRLSLTAVFFHVNDGVAFSSLKKVVLFWPLSIAWTRRT